MTTTRVFSCDDLFKFNNINFDKLTETYNLGFYLQYIATWPDYNFAIASPEGRLQGYSTASAAPAAAPQSLTRFPILYDKVLGKAEGKGEKWHGHVTAITVAAEYRRLGLARRLMAILEDVSDRIYKGFFVDLFVRASNAVAIGMYETLGYTTYRRVIGYYSGDEDAFDMRKAMSRDVEKKSVIPLEKPVHPEDIEWN